MKIILSLFFVLSLVPVFAENLQDKPLSVVVIGGGPAGLGAALEAKKQGAQVTVIEKRDQYERYQWLFLLNSSLKLLEKWNATIPEMAIAEIEDGEQIAFIPIKKLEETLKTRAEKDGITFIKGEFKNFKQGRRAVVILKGSVEETIPYDILVGADGVHSKVRESLGILLDIKGKAYGISALVPNTSEEFDISPAIKKESFFIRKMTAGSGSIIFMQNPNPISKNDLIRISKECGWLIESRLIENERSFVIDGIQIVLQQAGNFTLEDKSVILVGEAAASASFFQGMGANTALKAAELAGSFFQNLKEAPKNAYVSYNKAMKELTDEMIEDSLFLFENKQP